MKLLLLLSFDFFFWIFVKPQPGPQDVATFMHTWSWHHHPPNMCKCLAAHVLHPPSPQNNTPRSKCCTHCLWLPAQYLPPNSCLPLHLFAGVFAACVLNHHHNHSRHNRALQIMYRSASRFSDQIPWFTFDLSPMSHFHGSFAFEVCTDNQEKSQTRLHNWAYTDSKYFLPRVLAIGLVARSITSNIRAI